MKHPFLVATADGGLSLREPTDDGWISTAVVPLGPSTEPNGLPLAEPGLSGSRSMIRLLKSDGTDAGLAYVSPSGVPPVIAPRVPHYVNWSPRGDSVSFVAPAQEGLGLFLSDAGGAFSADNIASGSPLFSSWRFDSEAIAIHSGTDLELYVPGTRTHVPVSSEAVGFRTPVCIQDSVVYVVAEDGEARLTRWDLATYFGTLGFFTALFFLFMRLLPAISIFEMKDLVHKVAHKKAH